MNLTKFTNSRSAAGMLFRRCSRARFCAVLSSLVLSSIVSSFAGNSVLPTQAGQDINPVEKLAKPYFLTGSWGGLRPKLEDHGVTFDLFETFDTYGNVSGGDHRAEEYFGRTRLTMDVDLDKLVGWEGGEFYITAVTQEGENFAKTKINVYTNPSSIEGKQTTRLAEVWLQQKLWNDKLALKVGKIDGVAEFGIQEIGSTFMNDELNYVTNETFTAGMPFDPAGKPGAVLTLKPLDGPILSGLYAKAAIFAGNDDSAYLFDDTGASFAIRSPTILAAETGWRTPENSSLLPGAYKVGVHYNFGDTTRFDGTVARGNYFIYGNAWQTVLYLDQKRSRHLDTGFTLSGAPGDRNKNDLEATAIARIVGPWASRAEDEVGAGFIISNFSDDFGQQSLRTGGPDLTGSEKTLELTYKAQINRWLTMQPDVQFVFDPIGDGNRRTVVILGLRTVVVF